MKGVVFVVIAVFIAFTKCTPIDVPEPARELMPPKVDAENFYNSDGPTLATDLAPPPVPSEQDEKLAMLFLINIFAVKNETSQNSNEVLHDDVPFFSEPLTMFLLVVEDDNETNPVSLDDVAKDLEAEGFKIEKVMKDGVTSLIKVDLSSLGIENDEENDVNTNEKFIKSDESLESEASVLVPAVAPNQLSKIRRKRTLCLKCLKSEGHGGHGGFGNSGGFGGGGYGGGHGGAVGIVPVVVLPVATVGGGGYGGHGGHGGHGGGFSGGHGGGHGGGFSGGHGGGHGGGFGNGPSGHGGNGGFQQQPNYYPQQNYGGGGGSYSQASAQASAQSSSGSWNGK